MARYDNLGKGASGAAVQCLGLMLGLGWRRGWAAGRRDDAARDARLRRDAAAAAE